LHVLMLLVAVRSNTIAQSCVAPEVTVEAFARQLRCLTRLLASAQTVVSAVDVVIVS
jgi:hypothetical protein